MIKSKLEIILNSKIFVAFMFVFALIYIVINCSRVNSSIYTIDDEKFFGILKKMVVKADKVVFTISSGEEELICNYYLKEEESGNYYDLYGLGDKLEINGVLSEALNNTVPNTFNYKEYLLNRRSYYTCSIDEIRVVEKNSNIFYTFKNAIIKRIMSFDIRDYLNTMIIGDKSLIDEDTFLKYKQNGIMHLFAISGMHVGLFTAFFLKLFKRLKDAKKSVLTIAFIWFYAFLAGFSPSVIRACLLFSLISLFKLLKISVPTLNVLFLTAFVLILHDYHIIRDIGFIYSFVTTFGLIYSRDILAKHKVIGTSLVATLYSLPITVNNFYKINLLSVFLNIVFVPLVSVIIYPLCLLTFIFRFLEPITKASIFVLELLNDWCSKLDFLYIVIPKLSILVLIVYYVILILFLRRKLWRISAILIMVVLLNKIKPIIDSNYYVDFIDVGQGDSTLIRSKHSEEVILIDTGGKESFQDDNSNYHVASNTVVYLNSLGIDKIDLLILTHGDADHLGDALYLMDNINVKSVMLNRGELNAKEKEIVESGVKIVDGYDGSLKLEFLNDKDWKDENLNSIVTSFNILDNHFLIMGDASKEVERYILSSKNIEQVDILKLGHHGSKTSSDKNFLKLIHTRLAIISCGRKNRYNHPSLETINSLNELGIPYKNTQTDGTISLKIDSRGVTYSTCPP